MIPGNRKPASGPFPDGGAAQHAAEIARPLPGFLGQITEAWPVAPSGQRPAHASNRVGRFHSVTGRLVRPAFIPSVARKPTGKGAHHDRHRPLTAA
jgi:hypothetical protein